MVRQVCLSAVVLALVSLPNAAADPRPRGAAPVDPGDKTARARQQLLANLDQFSLTVCTVDLRRGLLTRVALVTDRTAVVPGEAFLITREQATATIDVLARSGLFNGPFLPPEVPPLCGKYVCVGGLGNLQVPNQVVVGPGSFDVSCAPIVGDLLLIG